eukprot:3920174-Amphidinium_carterae.1
MAVRAFHPVTLGVLSPEESQRKCLRGKGCGLDCPRSQAGMSLCLLFHLKMPQVIDLECAATCSSPNWKQPEQVHKKHRL